MVLIGTINYCNPGSGKNPSQVLVQDALKTRLNTDWVCAIGLAIISSITGTALQSLFEALFNPWVRHPGRHL